LAEWQVPSDAVSNIISNLINKEDLILEVTKGTTLFDESTLVEKGINPSFIEPLTNILGQHPEFMPAINSANTIEKAIGVYNDPLYSDAISDINNSVEHKGLGKGELALVLILRSARSGGSKSGDIEIGGKYADVKELDAAGEILVTVNALPGFRNLPFQKALMELKVFLDAEPEARDLLLGTVDKSDKNIVNFIKDPNIDEMGGSVFRQLEAIRQKLQKIPNDNPVDFAVFNIGGKKIMKSLEGNTNLGLKIRDNPKQEVVQLTISPFTDKASQYLIPSLKKLQYFSKQFYPQEITDEVNDILHYTLGVVVVKNGGLDAFYIPPSQMKNRFRFSRLSKGVKFKPI
jgi:hypothetical protein